MGTERPRSKGWVLAGIFLSVMLAGCQSRGQAPGAGELAAPGESAPAVSEQPGQPVGQPAAPPPAPVVVRAGPVQGGLEPGKAYPVGASGKNSNVQLTVTDLQIATTAGGAQAPAGHLFVVLGTVWKTLVETPYQVNSLEEHLYLLIDGRYVAEVAPASDQLPDPLPLTGLLLERHNAEVRGTVAFAVPAGAVKHLALQFYDFNHGHITVSLYGVAPG